MKIALVNLPIILHDIDDLAPPLGLLCLKDTVQSNNVMVQIFDFNLSAARKVLPDGDTIYEYIINDILNYNPELIGITSMGINSHIGLELAKLIKEEDPAVTVVLGGVHYSSIAHEITKLYPWIDHIVKGEGEIPLKNLTNNSSAIIDKILLNDVNPNLAIQRRFPYRALDNFDIHSYFSINRNNLLNIETGRGCKYQCPFCYSTNHWNRQYHLSIDTIIHDFNKAYELGAKHLFIVNDNFINKIELTRELCLELASGHKIPNWNCYVTLPDIDPDTPTILKRAGCNSVYIGIDAVTHVQKKALGKYHNYNLDDTTDKIKSFCDAEITPTCALILDPFNWNKEDLEVAYRYALKLRLLKAELSLHVLLPYPSTRLGSQYEINKYIYDETRIRILMDCHDSIYTNKYARVSPHLFPFHSRTVKDPEEYRYGMLQMQIAQNLLTHYPLEMLDILEDEDYTMIKVIDHIYSILLDRIGLDEHQAIALKREQKHIFERILVETFGFLRI